MKIFSIEDVRGIVYNAIRDVQYIKIDSPKDFDELATLMVYIEKRLIEKSNTEEIKKLEEKGNIFVPWQDILCRNIYKKLDNLIKGKYAQDIIQLFIKCVQMLQIIKTRGVTIDFNTVQDKALKEYYVNMFNELTNVFSSDADFIFNIMEKFDDEYNSNLAREVRESENK